MALELGQSTKTLLQQMVAALHRLVGVKLTVQTQELKKDDPSLHLGDVVLVRFMNRGEFPVLIDNQILLYPNESHVEGDTAGPGIDHPYLIEFQKKDANRAPDGVPVRPFLYPGKHLSIRKFVRNF